MTQWDVVCVILAAGEGTRMKSARPKVMHELMGRPLLSYTLDALRGLRVKKVYVVVGYGAKEVMTLLDKRAVPIVQRRRLGTGHALLSCRKPLQNFNGGLLILAGDCPLIQPSTLKAFLKRFQREKPKVAVLTATVAEPSGYGRIIRAENGKLCGIREELEASEEEKRITEVNSSIYLFQAKEVFSVLPALGRHNRRREYYLTDVIQKLADRDPEGASVEAYRLAEEDEILGVNTREDLAKLNRLLHNRVVEQHMQKGVTILSPENTYIEPDAVIGRDTVIYPFTWIETDVVIGSNCRIGPFAKIRSGCRIEDEAVVGSFVEVVRTRVGRRSLVKHQAYLGDAEVGRDVNIGAGTITANFDGRRKMKTKIGDGAFIGCDTILIAPVRVGKRARTGAGAVLLRGKNVPPRCTAVGVPARIVKRSGER